MEVLYYLLSSFSGLPAWTRYLFVALTVAAMVGISLAMSPVVGIIVAFGILLVVMAVGGFQYLIHRRRQRRAAEFGSEMQQASAITPGQIVDPAKRQRLDALRASFEKGIDKFRAAGKDLYQIPWYVIVGEPGAGKTEAIRHSQIGFPPGMQDEFQGVGGTINMNWWFTNDAVILDTAGRLLFEEVEAGGTGEWRVFLEMLKKYRPNCPINGLILAIPADALIKDTPDAIVKKAGKIAQQLETIQKHLDVRFPAYVAITKCDLLNGFREFFDDLTDAAAQHQMMGWANPDPLDAPFRPELVDAHIYTVVERLRRRRLGLMLDPVPRNADERRADEVDRLYALPHSVDLIGAPLKQYLQTIFLPGTWSEKPLFLRGIFFTSSLREGSALDHELALAVGIDVDQLPEGRAWERERSYFLRDVFVNKAFPERGLVTKATNTTNLVRKRRLSIAAVGTAALLGLAGLSWFGQQGLKRSVGSQAGYWSRASEGWTERHIWNPVVKKEVSGFEYVANKPVGQGFKESSRLLFNDPELPLSSFHARLLQLAATPLHVPWVFRTIASIGVEIDDDRRRAQRVVLEGGVVKPLLEATREKMSGAAVPHGTAALQESEALVSLIRLESNLVRRAEKRQVVLSGEQLIPPMVRYTTTADSDPALNRTLDQTYMKGGGGSGLWVADWAGGGSTLSQNTAIANGLSRFVTGARQTAASQSGGLPLINLVIKELRNFQKFEDDFAATARQQAPPERTDPLVLEAFAQLQKTKQSLDAIIIQAKNGGLFADDKVSLVAAYERLMGEARSRYELGRAMQLEAEEILSATSTGGAVRQTIQNVAGQHPSYTLFREISDKLKDVMTELESKYRGGLQEKDLAELKTLDEFYLTDGTTRIPHYELRWDLYQTAIKASPDPRHAYSLDLIGKEWKPLFEILARVGQIREQVQGYNGTLKEKALAICNYSFSRAERVHQDEFCKAWLEQSQRRVRENVRFPLVWEPLGQPLKGTEAVLVSNLLELMRRDIRSDAFAKIKSGEKGALKEFDGRIAALDPIRTALLTPERALRLSAIYIVGRATQFQLSGQQTIMGEYGGVQLRAGTIDHGAPVKGATPGRIPTDSAAEVELGRFRLDEAFHFHFHRTVADQTIAIDLPAADNWTAFRLLEENQSTRSEDGRRWRVGVRASGSKLCWFELRFDAPLPPIEDWPTLRSLGFGPRR